MSFGTCAMRLGFFVVVGISEMASFLNLGL